MSTFYILELRRMKVVREFDASDREEAKKIALSCLTGEDASDNPADRFVLVEGLRNASFSAADLTTGLALAPV